jgi:hypothetical protein
MIDLPETPAPMGGQASILDFGAILAPPLGGPLQKVERLGSRFKVSFQMPPMRGDDGRAWLSALLRGKREGARIKFPLLDFDPGAPGSPLVNGASQAGLLLDVDGATANYVFRNGQPFSIFTGSRHYLHFVTAETIANSSGVAADLPIFPALRKSPADNSPLYFHKPMVEGFILGDEWGWQMALDHNLGFQFEIMEIE